MATKNVPPSSSVQPPTAASVLMAVTGQVSASAKVGEAVVHAWQEAGLIESSAIKPIRTTVEKGRVIRKLGQLSGEDQQVLRTALSTILGK